MRELEVLDGGYLKLSWKDRKEFFEEELGEQVRGGVKRLLEEALEAERTDWLGVGRYVRDEVERRDYRNGYYRRDLGTQLGLLRRLQVPRTRRGCRSQLLPRYQRRQEAVRGLVREAFLRGVSTRQVGEVLEIDVTLGFGWQAMSSPRKPSRFVPAWIFWIHGLGSGLLVVAFTLLLGATVGIPAPTQSNKSAVKSAGASETPYLRKAQQALDAHNLAEAKTQLELALRADPKSADALLMLGFVEFQSGDTPQAIEHFERGLKLNPESFSGHYNLALAHLRQKDVAAGLHELERAVALNPQHAGAAYNLGLVLLEMGRPEEALTQLHRAKALGPEGADVSVNIARAELALHHVEEAKREADLAAKTFGNDPSWQATMGRLFLEHGQPQPALAHLTEAFRLQPSEIQVRRLLASAQLATGNPAAVLALIPAPESAEDHYLLAGALYLQRQLQEADEESRLASERDPQDSRILVLRARIRQLLGQHDAALELLKKASELTPQWSEPCYSAAVSYYLQRRYAEAQRSLDRALELDPNSVRALFLYAASLVNEGKNRQGEEFLRRAIELEPDNARFYYHLGALRLRDDRWSEATESFEKAAQLKPDYALPHYQLGKLLLRSNHPQAAVRELETAVRLQPDLAQAYYQLSRAYTLLGETGKSEQSLAAFAKLKQQELDEDKQMMEEVQRQSSSLAR